MDSVCLVRSLFVKNRVALIPAAKACNRIIDAGAMQSIVRAAMRWMPTVRTATSLAKPGGPNTSARRPRAGQVGSGSGRSAMTMLASPRTAAMIRGNGDQRGGGIAVQRHRQGRTG